MRDLRLNLLFFILIPILFTIQEGSTSNLKRMKSLNPKKVNSFEAEFIKPEVFIQLSNEQQHSYIREIKQTLVFFETHLSEDHQFSFKNWTWISNKAYAAANSWGPYCLIGGVDLKTINGKCPTRGNECNNKPNTFKCGAIFDYACIAREPVRGPNGISQRCFDANKNNDPKNYNELKNDLEAKIKKICSYNPKSPSPACRLTFQKMDQLNKKYEPNKGIDTPSNLSTPKQSKPLKPTTKNVCSPYDGPAYASHTSCLSCLMEYVYNHTTSSQQPLKVSHRWLYFLSVLKKTCDNRSTQTLIDEQKRINNKSFKVGRNWKVHDDLNLLARLGACRDGTYPFDSNNKLPLSDFKSGDPDPNLTDGSGSQWQKQFGISQNDALDIFCPKKIEDSLTDVNQRFKKMMTTKKELTISDEFKNCFQEAQKLNLSSFDASNRSFCFEEVLTPNENSNNKELLTKIKNVMSENHLPLPVFLAAQLSGSDQCRTILGFDEQKKEFQIYNGSGNQLQNMDAEKFLTRAKNTNPKTPSSIQFTNLSCLKLKKYKLPAFGVESEIEKQDSNSETETAQ